MRMRIAVVAAVVLILGWGPAGHAQSCEDALREAQKSFELGVFEDVPGQLDPCLRARVSRPVAVAVHSLLARAYLEMEESEKASAQVSMVLRLDSAFEAGSSSPRFAALVAEVRRKEMTTQVASVSKTSESLREAPATVTIITGEEIRRRGYLDLERVLEDLPAFDISRVNGSSYTNIYERGYFRSGRNLLLIDGVEQNDIAFNAASVARQFPLTNIDRIEIIYGPAATMYGADAYTGVISIITKSPENLLGGKKTFGLTGQVTGGGYGGGSVDVTAAGRDSSGTLAWAISANYQRSVERDLSGYDYWDYTFKNVDYRNKPWMRAGNSPAERAIFCSTPSPYIQCDASGASLTDAGVALVRSLDASTVKELGLGFQDHAKNWSIFGKLQLANLTLGIQSWRSQEGMGSEIASLGDSYWTPTLNAVYLKYSLPLSTLKLNVFTRYIQTSTERSDTAPVIHHSYNFGFLTLLSLVPPCQSPVDPEPVGCPARSWVERVATGNLSTQLRTEISAVWEPRRNLNGVAGIELTRSSVEGGYDQSSTGIGELGPSFKPAVREHTDYALYAQSAWKPWPSLKLALAGRFTYDQINNRPDERGFGFVFSPRVALVYAPPARPFVLKAIYSEAFKDPTDFQKYGVSFSFAQAYPSNGLEPERVKNVELNAAWNPTDALSVEGSAYRSRYSNIVSFGYPRNPDGTLVVDCTIGCQQDQNRDSARVSGLQLTARYRRGRSELWGNYTRTDSAQIDPLDFAGDGPLLGDDGRPVKELKAYGIAPNRANLGVATAFGQRFDTGLRLNYAGRRPMGPGTTFTQVNQIWPPLSGVGGRTTADVVLNYRVHATTTVQLNVLNLLDRQYWDPGTDDLSAQPAVLQPGRTFYLRLIYTVPR